MPEALPLAGFTVVVTRPRQQGEPTAKALRSAGATVVELPVLEILPVPGAIDADVMASAYAAIFVSANAVEYGVPFLRGRGGLSARTLIVAIGHATTRALVDAGFDDVVSPQQSIDSEGLLATPQLQPDRVKGQHIILVRGKSESGGRKLLEETLRTRGAMLAILECYERRALRLARAQIESLVKSMESDCAVMALSVETLDSLMKSFSGQEGLLKSTCLLVPHSRVAAAATDRGFTRVMEIGMSAESLIPALIKLRSSIDTKGN